MDDPFAPATPHVLADYHLKRMVLSPAHWGKFSLPHKLTWTRIKFSRENAGDVPGDKSGVYSFLVHPGIANHDACGYLMYVGKAEKQSLRARFKQYLKPGGRRHIAKMLRLWREHMWFYFAAVADGGSINSTEDALVNAYLPPFNHQYRGEVADELQDLFA